MQTAAAAVDAHTLHNERYLLPDMFVVRKERPRLNENKSSDCVLNGWAAIQVIDLDTGHWAYLPMLGRVQSIEELARG